LSLVLEFAPVFPSPVCTPSIRYIVGFVTGKYGVQEVDKFETAGRIEIPSTGLVELPPAVASVAMTGAVGGDERRDTAGRPA